MGPMVFLGDLGGHAGVGTTFIKDWNWNTTKLAVGAYAAVYPQQWLGFRLSFNYGAIEGFDASIKPKGGDEVSRLDRNLDFQSKIVEGTVMAEVYPTVFLEDDPDDVFARLRPYGVIGLGVFHFHPYGSYRDPNTGATEWVSLPELHTEGEGFPEYPNSKPYKLTQLNIPMGFGVKFFLSENVNLSFEIVHRKTFTDYIDDVHDRYIDPALFYKYLSPQLAPIAAAMSNKAVGGYSNPNYKTGSIRGNPGNNDAYFTAQFKLGIRLGGGSAQRWRNSTHCPLLRF
ncbi:hypothetical protein GCM10011511_30310 [Puia dinghuensis]|uniref:Outer membrane protein beta-barrel domain-containing protein n=2 Tax=Puia dinghuensis TaxID=1792502 RepID=A0A8J2UEN5_9BACT|nr:hypothetical protein GCM10011511_30310 [Puia dinghuensis]